MKVALSTLACVCILIGIGLSLQSPADVIPIEVSAIVAEQPEQPADVGSSAIEAAATLVANETCSGGCCNGSCSLRAPRFELKAEKRETAIASHEASEEHRGPVEAVAHALREHRPHVLGRLFGRR